MLQIRGYGSLFLLGELLLLIYQLTYCLQPTRQPAVGFPLRAELPSLLTFLNGIHARLVPVEGDPLLPHFPARWAPKNANSG